MTEILECKIRGCKEEALIARGRYARLCKIHKDEYYLTHVRKNETKSNFKLKDTAIRLVEISERIDERAIQYREAKNQLIIDIQEFGRLLDSLKMELKTIVNDNAN